MGNDFRSVTISESTPIRDALRQLCDDGRQILVVVDGDVLRGTVSDGDIRRWLLKGGSIDAPIREAANFHAKFLLTSEREKAERFVWENKISAVPIVDDDMTLVDVVFLHESVDVEAVTIRQLVPADLAMVLEFFDQMAGDTRAMFNRNDVNRIRVMEHLGRTQDDHQIHFAAVVKNVDGTEKMVGYVFLWDLDKKLPWLGIAVREDWKGHHLGRKLLAHLDDYAQPRGYGGLMLTSVPANVRAHSLYERMGFSYYGVFIDSEFLYIKRYDQVGM